MGEEPDQDTVPYEPDIQAALYKLRSLCSRVRNSTGPSSIPRLLKLPSS